MEKILQKKELLVGNLAPPSSKEGYLREGLRSPSQRLNILIQNIAVLYLPFLFCQYKCI